MIRRNRIRSISVLALASMGLSPWAASIAQADADWPSRPVRIVVGYQAGGPTDLVARMLADKLHAALGKPFVVENKPGAGSNLATEAVINAKPDGYTFLLAGAPIASNPFVYRKLKWTVLGDLEPVSMVMSAPAVLAVAPNFPATNVQELIALAKAEPGRIAYGSSGAGGTQHVAGELFKKLAGIDLVHIPYKGAAPALTDLMGGQIQTAFMTSLSAMPFFLEHKVRPIAVAAEHRLAQLPDVPTFAEAGVPGVLAESWNGLFAPIGTPPAILQRLHAEVVKVLALPEIRAQIEPQGGVVVGNSPQEYRAFLQKEVARWTDLFKTIDISIQ